MGGQSGRAGLYRGVGGIQEAQRAWEEAEGVVWAHRSREALAASPEPGGGLAVGLVLRWVGLSAPHRKTGGGGLKTPLLGAPTRTPRLALLGVRR